LFAVPIVQFQPHCTCYFCQFSECVNARSMTRIRPGIPKRKFLWCCPDHERGPSWTYAESRFISSRIRSRHLNQGSHGSSRTIRVWSTRMASWSVRR